MYYCHFLVFGFQPQEFASFEQINCLTFVFVLQTFLISVKEGGLLSVGHVCFPTIVRLLGCADGLQCRSVQERTTIHRKAGEPLQNKRLLK